MVRFSCFPSHIHTHKQKKSVQSSPGPNGNYSASQISKNSTNFEMKSPSELNTNELDWKSEQIENKSNTESDLSIRKDSRMRKSISLGSLLNHEANESDYESDHKFSPNRSELIIENSSKVQESIFTIADPDLGIEKFSPRAHRNIVKSKSTSDLRLNLPTHHPSLRKCKSSEGIYVIDTNMKEISPQHEDRNVENALEENYDTYNYIGSAKEWIVPVTNEDINGKLLSRWDNIPSEDFKHKRIQEWVFDLQHYDPLDETHETNEEKSFHLEPKNDSISSKLDGKLNQNQNQNQTMEGVKRYLTSLNPSSTTAQLVNHGLTVIPFLSAFTSLKALNLSGNSIGKITAGTLPRGLHVLNLSKNNISTIEGLRELTRLRILDLSYNRILRLGHGLASCSSLKELYLAGNKISEVEGLHRLLKLNVLDLRFNKISTTKCLGQLAANYNSLQAIGLDGNPAQKNIGDEHLKKYLQGLLPHLAYYNRQAVKTTKDGNGRGERNLLRSEMKSSVRKSSLHGRKSVAAVGTGVVGTSSRGRSGRVPVVPTHGGTGAKGKFYEFGGGNKLLNFKSHLSISMHKSRSEGTLAAL